jgi:hypothetical protein
VMDKQERDKVLLGAAAVALTAALGLTCHETLMPSTIACWISS